MSLGAAQSTYQGDHFFRIDFSHSGILLQLDWLKNSQLIIKHTTNRTKRSTEKGRNRSNALRALRMTKSILEYYSLLHMLRCGRAFESGKGTATLFIQFL